MNIPMMTLENSKALAQRIGQIRTFGHFIAGQWVEGNSGETIELYNPATRQILAHIQSGNAEDVDRAVNAAHEAFPNWSRTSPMERQRILLAIADRLKRRQSDFAMMGTLNNGKTIGEALVSHPKVRKVTFTGSRATAQKIIRYASANIIPQTMELGGKSANIICEDADLDAAAESAVMTTILNKGEVCLAGTRVFVHKKVRDAFLDRFRYQLAKVRQGDPVDPANQLGAQSSEVQFKRVNSYIELGKAEGAVALTGGGPAKIAGLENGLFIEPTIFINVRNEMRIAQEEIFGPVTGVMEWEDEAELVRLANETVYALHTGLWRRDLAL